MTSTTSSDEREDRTHEAASRAPRRVVTWRRLVAAVIGVATAVLALLYGVDAVLFRYRLQQGTGLEQVTIYTATYLKNGKVEIFSDQPQIEYCARSLFPQAGYHPCWYARRHTVRLVSSNEFARYSRFAGTVIRIRGARSLRRKPASGSRE